MENPSAKEIWDKASQLIKSEINGISYDSWFKDIVPVSFDGQVLTLLVNIEFIRNMLRNNYDQLIQAALMQAAGEPVRYVVRIPSEMNAPREEAPARPSAAASMLNPKYTFSTYVIGKSNNFAHAAAYAVSQSPGDTYNPLFLYSGVGLGKTHLMHAIGHAILEKNPQSRILYITSETFTNDLINAISSNTNSEFRNRYRNVDVLMVDDIQFIAGKESTQEEFFHTFNTLYEAKKQIVLTSDRPPKDIATLEERLLTRFEWGLTADIQPPDFETRIAIIKRKAELLGIDLPNNVIEYIANRLKNNIRQLEGTVKKMKAYYLLNGDALNLSTAQMAVSDIINNEQPVPVTVEKIIEEVARTYGTSPEDIRSSKRSANISNARQVAMYVVREITQMPMTSIGEEFGGRDHSTVVYAIQQVEKGMARDPKTKGTVEDIIKNIRDR